MGRFNWRGEDVQKQVKEAMAQALGEIGLEVEKGAKGHLWPGHGVDTRSLQGSIHTAEPGYNWKGDHRYPDGPERGGKLVPAQKGLDGNLHLEVGSGQKYAIWVLLKYYAYLWVGLRRGVQMASRIIRKHRIGR